MPTHHGMMMHTPEYIKRVGWLLARPSLSCSFLLRGRREENFYLIKGRIVHYIQTAADNNNNITTILRPRRNFLTRVGYVHTFYKTKKKFDSFCEKICIWLFMFVPHFKLCLQRQKKNWHHLKVYCCTCQGSCKKETSGAKKRLQFHALNRDVVQQEMSLA